MLIMSVTKNKRCLKVKQGNTCQYSLVKKEQFKFKFFLCSSLFLNNCIQIQSFHNCQKLLTKILLRYKNFLSVHASNIVQKRMQFKEKNKFKFRKKTTGKIFARKLAQKVTVFQRLKETRMLNLKKSSNLSLKIKNLICLCFYVVRIPVSLNSQYSQYPMYLLVTLNIFIYFKQRRKNILIIQTSVIQQFSINIVFG